MKIQKTHCVILNAVKDPKILRDEALRMTFHFALYFALIMKLSRKTSRLIWIIISVIGVASMVAFTLLPLIYYR